MLPMSWLGAPSQSDTALNEAARLLALLAALSHQTNFSVGCYCAEGSHCHRSVLKALLQEYGAKIAPLKRK